MSTAGAQPASASQLLTNLDDYAKATLNILEDFDAERLRLLEAQGAMLNMLADSAAEKAQIEEAQRAIVNVLEDSVAEKAQIEEAQRAIVNILEDSVAEKAQIEEAQRAMLNLLEDFNEERGKAEVANRELREVFESLRQAKEAAEAVNKELEAFSYSVSHDLRAPLRAIHGFSRILLEEHLSQLPEDAARYLRMVRANTQQMGELVDDLLNFSRLSRQPINRRVVAPASVVTQAFEDLHAERDDRRVEFVIGELPRCEADPALVRQVFANLLSNALKFTRNRETARIEVGADRQEGGTIYFVKDNGVGFDMQYADKLFGVFQRLHRAEDYEGTGVGLAIVQRIVNRHGGRVWADARLNDGATFYFTLGGDITDG